MVGLVQEGGVGGAIKAFLRSSIGKKVLVGLTGLALVGFLIAHLGGNLLIYKGEGEAFNAYAHALEDNPLLIPAEIGLLAIFLAHVGLAALVTRQNRKARPVAYTFPGSEGGRTLASSTMIFTGAITFAFVVVHLINFKFAARPPIEAGVGGLHALVMAHFQSVLWVLVYVACMAVIGLHVSHGLQSAFRSLGLVHPRYTPWIDRLSLAFGGLLFVGFASIPIWALIAGPVSP